MEEKLKKFTCTSCGEEPCVLEVRVREDTDIQAGCPFDEDNNVAHWVEEETEEFEKMIKIVDGYDHTDQPNKGRAPIGIYFALVKDNKAVSWIFSTGIYPHISNSEPTGFEIVIHSPEPYEHGLGGFAEECEHTGGECFVDVSATSGEKLGEKFMRTGKAEVIWDELEEWYRSRLEE